jgi:hypothetical protein
LIPRTPYKKKFTYLNKYRFAQYALVTSDPVINSPREFSCKKTGKLPLEVLNLIVPPIIPPQLVENRIMCDDEDYLGSDSSDSENNNDSSDDN